MAEPGMTPKSTSALLQANESHLARSAAFEELKIYGRDPRQADPIFSEKVSLPC